MSQISFQNSLTTQNITSPFTFIGEYVDITAFAEVNVLLQGTLASVGDNYTISAYLSNDRVNVLETIETVITYPTSNKLIKITPSANYIKIKLESVYTITNFNMSTVLRSVLPLSGITNINGVVSVSNFPAEQAVTGSFYQPTQPVSIAETVVVSGTFYQPTQPVSIAETVDVSGTFYQPTQPVSIAETVAVSGSISLLPATDPNSTIGTVRLNDAYGSPLVTTAGNLMIGINNIYTTNALHTIIDSIDNTLTFQCQERPTTESYFTTAVGTGGIAISLSPKTLRNFSINTTSAVIVYVYLYDTGAFPVPGDTPKFVFPIMNANNIVFNSFDHRFEHGIGIRATTTYNGIISPAANTVFVNMTISD